MSLYYRGDNNQGEKMDLGNVLNGVKPEESTHSGALPMGNYNVKVDKVEGKTTKAGGKAINIQMRVFGAKYANAVLFDFINIEHPTSVKTAEIGKARLAKIAALLGSTNTDPWIGKPLSVFVTIESSEAYGDQNRVKAYNEFALDTTPVINAESTKTVSGFSSDDIPF